MSSAGWNLEHTYITLPQLFYQKQLPQTVPQAEMVLFNDALAESLGLNAKQLRTDADLFAGKYLPDGANPIAQAYAGHQFGHFAMLGDGRALLLGEQITPGGKRFDIALKGSGITPYARRGDGQAALAPTLREYIISEAMAALSVPTTRSLAVALTGKQVLRERALQGAVLTRVASSHIRVGTFSYAAAFGGKEQVKQLADYSIQRHFPWLQGAEDQYLLFFREILKRQASLIAKWQLVGFIHGVMNTDNMAISGETIDYGPCAFMDSYDPNTVFSSIDTVGRYAYQNQPKAGAWNLGRLAEALLHLFHERQEAAIQMAEQEMEGYWANFDKHWLSGMRQKLGLFDKQQAEDRTLVEQFLHLMQQHRLDYTSTFRALSEEREDAAIFSMPEFSAWLAQWRARMSQQVEAVDAVKKQMQLINPAVIPRNHQVEKALAIAEKGDISAVVDLLKALKNPYEKAEGYEHPPAHVTCGYQTFCGT